MTIHTAFEQLLKHFSFVDSKYNSPYIWQTKINVNEKSIFLFMDNREENIFRYFSELQRYADAAACNIKLITDTLKRCSILEWAITHKTLMFPAALDQEHIIIINISLR